MPVDLVGAGLRLEYARRNPCLVMKYLFVSLDGLIGDIAWRSSRTATR
jgi:hypothetical protein